MPLKNCTSIFRVCKGLTEADGLGRVLQSLPNLTSVKVSFADRPFMSSLESFGKPLPSGSNLTGFDFDVSYLLL